MNSFDLILDRIAQRVAERKGVLLVKDSQWANTGTLRTIDSATLAQLGSVTYDFQQNGVHFGPMGNRVAALWYDEPRTDGQAPWVCGSIPELIDAVVAHLLPQEVQ